MTYVDPSAAGANVTYTEPTATDNSGNVILYYQTKSSGDFFDVGETTVNYYFRDSSRNSVRCEFTVTVQKGKEEIFKGELHPIES